MTTTTENTLRVETTSGYVMVFVPVYDCDGMQRSIDFPRVGKTLYGSPLLHWTAKRYYKQALKVARKAAKAL